jgi:N-acetylated-alpha-linked acidic dipeptidase
VQRGSAQFLSLCAGDPFRTDARYDSATATQDLCSYNATDTIPAIPVLPLSYGDAGPLLAALGGADGPADFQGGITGLTYTMGPSVGKVLRVAADNGAMVETPIWNVVATIPGTLPPDADQPVTANNNHTHTAARTLSL